ncbi:MAG TPA: hydroxymethylbilane synthase [Vicinamibacterales bacterium]|nr:hydroxymethylbilane synthase [Vicinamibacterales bacterium]
MHTLRLGTRGSQLALWQANTVKRRIEDAGGPPCEIVVIKTSGDRLQDAPLSEVGGKRLFVKEIEDALLRKDVDFAVHSSKDMPAVLPDGLVIAGVLPREEPLDAIVLPASSAHAPTTITELVARLGESPSIGTSSVRRIAQLTRLFPGARFAPIRGNLDTRLRKLDEGQHDAIVLAAAGLRRLGFASRISMTIPAEACVPAPGQGIVAIEIREGDEQTRRAVARIEDQAAAAALTAERAVVERLGGGCQTPIGALATAAADGQIEIVGAVVSLDGSRAVRAHARGPREDALALGTSVGEQLLAQGAGDILAEAQQSSVASRQSSVEQP